MELNENEKNRLLIEYDRFLDCFENVPEGLITDISQDRTKLIDHCIFEQEHEDFDKFIINRTIKDDTKMKKIAFDYIKQPDFEVHAYYKNPVYSLDFDKLSSISQSVVIVKTLDCFFELKHYVKYLDKGLIQLALHIKKIMVAPGVYKLVEEVVPIHTTAYNEMLKKLIHDFKVSNHRLPNEDELKSLKSNALRKACDKKIYYNYSTYFYPVDTKIGESAVLYENTKLINNFTRLIDYEAPSFKNIFYSSNAIIVTDWSAYKDRILKLYGIQWNDDYYSFDPVKGTNIRKNIWNNTNTQYFDNRLDYSLTDQKVLYKK